MKRQRNRRSPLNVTLFPFLAVLICTLGVLIVLLVLAVRAADVKATQDQVVHQEEQQRLKTIRREKEFELDSWILKSEFLAEARPELVDQLSRSREYRGYLEGELRRLNHQLQELADSLKNVSADDSADGLAAGKGDQDLQAITHRVARLQESAEKAREELEKKRSEVVAGDKKLYSIVPHIGSGGTFRRPIFIEATAQSLVLQPLGIRLDRNDFVPPLGPGNPLDAALLAIRDYWLKHDVQRSEGSPYPLIVIRPDGAEGYAIARHAMSSWEDEFGYEMVEQEKELDFGSPDPELKALVESVVEEAKAKQRAILVTRSAGQHLAGTQPEFSVGTSRARRADQRPGLTASGSAGGFVIHSNGQQVDAGNDQLALNSGGERSQNPGLAGFERDARPLLDSPAGGSGGGGFPDGSSADGSSSRDFKSGLTSQFQGETAQGGAANSQTSSAMSAGDYQALTLGREPNSGAGTANPSEITNDDSPACLYQHLNLARQRGANWALPTKAVNQTGYVRPIRLVCSADSLEVRSSVGVEKVIPIGEDVSQVIDPLVTEIWRQIEAWGLPGSRSYWKPELRISVLPGGELNFEKLQGLLFNSGVDVRENLQ
jgi:hypothetical protein